MKKPAHRHLHTFKLTERGDGPERLHIRYLRAASIGDIQIGPRLISIEPVDPLGVAPVHHVGIIIGRGRLSQP